MAGTTIAPARATFTMFSRWIRVMGVSLGTTIRGLLSFMVTSAALTNRLSAKPDAIAPSVCMLHGMITIASTGNEPEDNVAAMSLILYTFEASLSTSAGE